MVKKIVVKVTQEALQDINPSTKTEEPLEQFKYNKSKFENIAKNKL